jgi:mono/diheme cytochrome c family protein
MRWILIALYATLAAGAELPAGLRERIDAACAACHSGSAAQGGLDLRALPFKLDSATVRERWVRIYDRVEKGEMPPGPVASPPRNEKRS